MQGMALAAPSRGFGAAAVGAACSGHALLYKRRPVGVALFALAGHSALLRSPHIETRTRQSWICNRSLGAPPPLGRWPHNSHSRTATSVTLSKREEAFPRYSGRRAARVACQHTSSTPGHSGASSMAGARRKGVGVRVLLNGPARALHCARGSLQARRPRVARFLPPRPLLGTTPSSSPSEQSASRAAPTSATPQECVDLTRVSQGQASHRSRLCSRAIGTFVTGDPPRGEGAEPRRSRRPPTAPTVGAIGSTELLVPA